MRKLIIKSAFVAAFIAVAGYAAYNTQKDTEMSDLAMANVEALAGGEGSGYDCPNGCLTSSGDCFCREYFPYKEASW